MLRLEMPPRFGAECLMDKFDPTVFLTVGEMAVFEFCDELECVAQTCGENGPSWPTGLTMLAKRLLAFT